MAEIPISDWSEGELDGQGAFDRLMKSAKGHLEQEYIKGRIKGPEYATVYLGIMKEVMAQSLQFVLQKGIQRRQELLLDEQLNTQIETTQLVREQYLHEIEKKNFTCVSNAHERQKQKLTAAQELATLASTNKVAKESALTEIAITKTTKEIEVMNASILKTNADIKLSDAQKVLINTKAIVERASVDGSVIGSNSLLDKQRMVSHNQAIGFKSKADLDAQKLGLDAWSVASTIANAAIYSELPSYRQAFAVDTSGYQVSTVQAGVVNTWFTNSGLDWEHINTTQPTPVNVTVSSPEYTQGNITLETKGTCS